MQTDSSYGRKAAGGAAYMGLAQAVSVVITIAMTVIVARMLSPDDYGVLAMVAPVTAFLLMFRHLGLNHATVQAKTLTHDQSNALFWINMGASAAITLILLALAPLVAWFYGDPRPGYITAASAATVMAGGSTIQHAALLNREMRFGRLGAIDIASSVMTLIATVTAAWLLRSYWALWIGTFVASLTTNILIWRSSCWRPSFKVSFQGTGQMIRFGGAITGFNLLNFLNRNLDNVLIGRVWGAGPLGLYDRSYRLMMFPLQNVNAPLAKVMLPVFSRLQDEPERLRRSYLLTLRLLMIATLPGIAVAGATSEELIPFLLSERWAAAAPIFTWLSLAALLQPLSNTTGWLFIVSGRGGALLRWGAFSSAVTVVAFIIGVREGPVGVAIAYFIATAIKIPLLLPWCVKGTSIRTLDLYAVAIPSFISAAAAWLAASWLVSSFTIISTLLLALPIAYAAGVLAHCLTSGGRGAVREISDLAISTGTAWVPIPRWRN